MQHQFVLIRYGNLVDMNNDGSLLKNYLFPIDHPIVPLARIYNGTSGYSGEPNEILLHDFFQHQPLTPFETTLDILSLCRQPDVVAVFELFYWT